MSGGVDSSVAARLLSLQGFECAGLTMVFHENSIGDAEEAASIAAKLGIPHYICDCVSEFQSEVVDPFADEYLRGRTPNPCVVCNRRVKFKALLDFADANGFGFVATGHYARCGDGILKKGADTFKDQSYMLSSLPKNFFSRVLFPLGNLLKRDVKTIAEKEGFAGGKKESQDICFIPNGRQAEFIEVFAKKRNEPGDFVDKNGKILGRHKGFAHYTVGQRKGIGIAMNEPAYVCGLDYQSNAVTLGGEEDLFSSELTASDFNWIGRNPRSESFRTKAKIRYRHAEQPCVVTPLGENKTKITFDEGQRAITPGQAAVVYDGDVVIGGGTID